MLQFNFLHLQCYGVTCHNLLTIARSIHSAAGDATKQKAMLKEEEDEEEEEEDLNKKVVPSIYYQY